MKLIVGLGNPGDIYADTRHNIGFLVVKSLAKIHKAALKKERGPKSLGARIEIGDKGVVLAAPLTFMNLSGIAVAALIKKYRIKPDNLLVVCDDLDLELGRQKLRPKGSSGGHRGLESIIGEIDSQQFARLRIGIGRPAKGMESSEYVLSPFCRKERAAVNRAVEDALDCCSTWVTQGIAKTMNIFNKRSPNNE